MKIKQQFISTLCVIGSVVMVGGIHTATIAAVAPESGVQLYTGENYSGTKLLFSPGETYSVSLQLEYKNQISSLKVPEGFVVTLVDRDGRRSQSFSAGDHQTIQAQMNNAADAVIVIAA